MKIERETLTTATEVDAASQTHIAQNGALPLWLLVSRDLVLLGPTWL